MADYIVEKDGWIAGRLRRAGDRVSLSASQAKYEHVRPVEGAAPSPASGPAPAPKRGAKSAA